MPAPFAGRRVVGRHFPGKRIKEGADVGDHRIVERAPIFRDVAQHRHAEYEAVLLFLGPGEAALSIFCEPFSVQ